MGRAAHESKLLLRVEGPTPDLPTTSSSSAEMNASRLGCTCASCAISPRDRRAITLRAQPQRLLGYISDEKTDYYVHAWRVHYTEVSIRDIRDAIELGELAYDFGLQLGRGHPRSAPGTEAGNRERAAIKAAIVAAGPGLADKSRALAVRTRAGYARFKQASESKRK
jgi:hypothetical protein